MNNYVFEMEKRKQELEQAIAKAENYLLKAPSGSIRTSCAHGGSQFYHVYEKTSCAGKYLPKTHQDMITKLIQKEYSKAFLKEATKELSMIDNFLKRHATVPPEHAIDKLHKNKIQFAKPYLYTDEEIGRLWEQEPYQISDYKIEERVYPTNKGENVRTKSEAAIANMYYEMGIPYRYECALKLANGKIKFPDFTILDTRKRRIIYHEHMGKLDDDGYRKKNLIKLSDYRKNGIYTGKNLILTFEGVGNPFNINELKKNTAEMFL
ncbi:MAG: hypothetical protein IJ683_05560 [Butyrivibrio sp.]|nr:hypothetical protein [Butyrivibrio sp.]MBR1641774.1 hypothetical protein [Butyrivibrio sp.]